MVSFYSVFSVVLIATATVTDAWKVGDYFRPSGRSVSGFPTNNTATYRRSPCPAVNALANHGYLPRNGKNITKLQLRDAVVARFNLTAELTDTVVAVLPEVFDLNLLGTHGLIEHDASLVHADSITGTDPAKIDETLLNDVLKRASPTQPLTIATLAQVRKERVAACVATNPSCTFTAKEVRLGAIESSLILIGFGDAATETASLARAESFLKFERFPADYKPTLMTGATITATIGKLIAASA